MALHTISFNHLDIVGDSRTRYVISNSGKTLEIIADGPFEGSCLIPFNQLNLAINKSLSNHIITFEIEFMKKLSNSVGQHGGVFFGSTTSRWIPGGTVCDWLEGGKCYRLYNSSPICTTVLSKEASDSGHPSREWKVVLKENGLQTFTAGDFSHTITNETPSINRAFLGFWCYYDNHIKVSNLTIQPLNED